MSTIVLTSNQEILDYIMTAYKERIDYVFQGALRRVTDTLQDRIKDLIMVAPETDALINGDLAKQLGVTDPTAIVNDIINVIQKNMVVRYDPLVIANGRIIDGGYTIQILQSDFQDVLSVNGAAFVSKNGANIPWLSWLLFASDAPIIYGYRVLLDPNTPESSRTGAIMVKSPGTVWSVPSEYAGTQEDNFLTRALSSLETEIENILRREL